MLNRKEYSLRKSKKILRQCYSLYKRKKKTLTNTQKKRFENIATSLQTATIKKDQKAANKAAKNLEKLSSQLMKKTFLDQCLDFIFAIMFALIVAIVIRQMWFELFTIPTGSMRPTLKEKDFLIVSKTDFGINVPLNTKHLYFNPNLLHRGSIVVFSSADMDMKDINMLYFYVLPGKKQLVKRLIGKPGDTLYFYGGKIYGIDSNEKEIKELNDIYFEKIEHIPFITFEGSVSSPSRIKQDILSPIIFSQMNEPIAILDIGYTGKTESELLINKSPVFTNKSQIEHYFDIWGFKNYAMTRILNREEIEKYSNATLENIEETELYLEITHHPTINPAKRIIEYFGIIRPALDYSYSVLPLNTQLLEKIFNNINTCRFRVKKGYAYNYGSKPTNTNFLPKLNIPDGTYEFFDGTAYKINFSGIATKLPKDHPIYDFSIERVKLFYNLGFEFNKQLEPHRKNQLFVPKRYAYFRDRDFYLMGKKILTKDNPILVNFLNREFKKQAASNSEDPYYAFEDLGVPINADGEINKNIIQKYGITIPEKMYLVLGDNHAMSSDSRDFGFVPEGNLRGGVNFIFWPPSDQWGKPFQPKYKILSFPKITVWSSAFVLTVLAAIYTIRRNKKKLKF